ncbi:hypothetical protein [Streptomyces sp. NPDC014006]|uniref:hypothetical protein n=1 Tax=Streptomyces sp. NPDC014006 TaxID=3364870 RepID=UPI0036F57641
MSAPAAERPPVFVDRATMPGETPPAPLPVARGGTGPGVAEVTAVRRRERRGLATVIGAFAICPCHLPLMLALLGAALGGTAAGVFLREHIWLAGSVITLVWVALTWRGLWLVRKGRSCPVPGASGSGVRAWSRWRPGARREG